MDIIHTEAKVSTWEQNTGNDEYQFPFIAIEKPGFLLLAYNKEFKQLFKITTYFQISTHNTDFILDIKTEAISQLEPHGKDIKALDLYRAYLDCRNYSIGIIMQESVKRGFQPPIALVANKAPSFEELRVILEKAIYESTE